MGLIPAHFIEELLDKVDLVDLINRYHPLKKVGANFKSKCPFPSHSEKTASFTVNPGKNIYKCFGCNKGGDAISFIREYLNLNFVDSVEKIASIYGLEIPKEYTDEWSGKNQEKYTKYYAHLLQAKEYFMRNINCDYVINYLKSRGLNKEIVNKFGIGFALNGWDNLINYFNKLEVSNAELIDVGLITRNDHNKQYDKFRDRIMFPIHDHRGRVVGFGGRVLNNGEPKYLNSPETPVFSKRKILYGLFESLKENRHLKSIIIVEGYMDVVALARSGISNAVATLGTAITEDHIIQAFKYTNEIIYCYDGDNAGKKAALKALELTLPFLQDGRKVKFLILPPGEDPDSIVTQGGSTAFLLQLEASFSLSDFFFNELQKGLNLSKLEEKAGFGVKAKKLLSTLPDGILRQMMFAKLNNILGFNNQSGNRNYISNKWKNRLPANDLPLSPVIRAIAIIVARQDFVHNLDVDDLEKVLINFNISNWEIVLFLELIKIIKFSKDKKLFDKDCLSIHLTTGLQQKFIQLEFHQYLENIPREGFEDELKSTIVWMKHQLRDQEIAKLIAKAKIDRLSNSEKSILQKMLLDKDLKVVD